VQRCNYFYVLIFFQIFINGMGNKDVSSIIAKNCYSVSSQYFLGTLHRVESTSIPGYYRILFFPSTDRIKFIKKKNSGNDTDLGNVVLDFQLRYFTDNINLNASFFFGRKLQSYYEIRSALDKFEKTVFKVRDGTPLSELLLLNDSAQDDNGNIWTVIWESKRLLGFYCMTNPEKKKRVHSYKSLAGYKTLCVHHNVPGLEVSLMTNDYCDIFKTNKTDSHEIPVEQYRLVPAMSGLTKHEFLGKDTIGILAAKQFYFGYINHCDKTIECKKQTIKEFVDDQLTEAQIIAFSAHHNPLLSTAEGRTRFIVLLTKSGKLLCMDINQACAGTSFLKNVGNISQIKHDKFYLKEINKISFYDNQISLYGSSKVLLEKETVLQVQLPDDWYHYYEVMNGPLPYVALFRGPYRASIVCIQSHIRKFLAMKNRDIKEKSIVAIQVYVRMALAKNVLEQLQEMAFSFFRW
jgi:hypothetical protein